MYAYDAFRLSIRPWMDIWVVSTLGYCECGRYEHWCTRVFESLLSAALGVYRSGAVGSRSDSLFKSLGNHHTLNFQAQVSVYFTDL